MGLFNKDLKIGAGERYDANRVASEGVSKEEAAKDKKKLIKVFQAFDLNGDNTLDAVELARAMDYIDSLDEDGNGNDKLSKKELRQGAAQLNEQLGLEGKDEIKARDIKKFLKNIQKSTEGDATISRDELFKYIDDESLDAQNIKKSEVVDDGNGGKKYVISYDNETQVTLNGDGSYQVKTEDEQGTVSTQYHNKDKKLLKETNVYENNDTEVTDFDPNQEAEVPLKTVSTRNNGAVRSELNYVDGKPATETVTSDGGATVENYEYHNEEAYLVQKTENKGTEDQQVSRYAYNNDGTINSTVTNKDGKAQQVLDEEYNVLSETVNLNNGTTIKRVYNDDRSRSEHVTDKNNRQTYTEYNAGGKRLQQTVVGANGKQYDIKYDGNGNTEGIIVQFKESPADIAKRFGCSVDDLIALNKDKLQGSGKGAYFNVGDSVKVPGELDADAKALQGRDSREQAIAKYEKHQAWVRRDKALRQAGLKSYERAGEVFTYGGKEYKIIGTMKNRARTMVQGPDGKYVIASWDNKILKEEYVDLTTLYDNNKKVKLADGQEYVIVQDRGDRHGRKIALDRNGNVVTVSGGKSQTDLSDRVILNDDYVEASDAYDAGLTEETYSDTGTKMARSKNGRVWYFDRAGHAVDTQTVVDKETAAIKKDLDEAASGFLGTGLGTDEELMAKANAGIKDPAVLAKLNSEYAAKYSNDVAEGKYRSNYEAFLGSELSKSEVSASAAALVSNRAIVDQDTRNEIIKENLLTYGDKNENLQAGLDAISTREDFDAASEAAAEYNEQQGYKAQFKDQSAINTLIYGQTGGDEDDIAAANNALIDPSEDFLTEEEITRTKAEQGVYYLRSAQDTSFAGLRQGEVKKALAGDDPQVYEEMDKLLQETGDKPLKQQTVLNSDDYTRLALSGYGEYSDDELAKMALGQLKDAKISENAVNNAVSTPASMTMGTAFSTAATQISAAKSKGQSINDMYKLLRTKGAYDKFMQQVENDPQLKEFLKKEGFDPKRLVLETDKPTLSDEEITKNKAVLEQYKKYIGQNKRAFDKIASDEGAIDSFLNTFRETYGMGITRDDLSNIYKNAGQSLHQLELAAEGRLVDADGNRIKFEDLTKKLDDANFQEASDAYQRHQAYANMGLDVTLAIATIPIGGEGFVALGNTVLKGAKTARTLNTLRAVGSGVGVGTAQYTKERIDQVTSSSGDTMANRGATESQTITNAILTTTGVGVGSATSKLYSQVNSLVKKASAFGIDVASDTFISAAADYIQNGEISQERFLENLMYSAIGTTAGHLMSGTPRNTADPNTPVQRKSSRPSGDKPKYEIPENETPFERATRNGNNPSEVAPKNAVREIGKDNFDAMVDDVRQQVRTASDAELEVLKKRGQALSNREQSHTIQHLVEDEQILRQLDDATNLGDLHKLEKKVSSWSDDTRRKAEILDRIETKRLELQQNGTYTVAQRSIDPQIKANAEAALAQAKKHLDPTQINAVKQYVETITDPAELNRVVENLKARGMKLQSGRLKAAINAKYAELNMPVNVSQAEIPSEVRINDHEVRLTGSDRPSAPAGETYTATAEDFARFRPAEPEVHTGSYANVVDGTPAPKNAGSGETYVSDHEVRLTGSDRPSAPAGETYTATAEDFARFRPAEPEVHTGSYANVVDGTPAPRNAGSGETYVSGHEVRVTGDNAHAQTGATYDATNDFLGTPTVTTRNAQVRKPVEGTPRLDRLNPGSGRLGGQAKSEITAEVTNFANSASTTQELQALKAKVQAKILNPELRANLEKIIDNAQANLNARAVTLQQNVAENTAKPITTPRLDRINKGSGRLGGLTRQTVTQEIQTAAANATTREQLQSLKDKVQNHIADNAFRQELNKIIDDAAARLV